MKQSVTLVKICQEAPQKFRQIRWKNGVSCPYCGSVNVYESSDRYRCKECKHKFTDKTGTMFAGSHISIGDWFVALYLILKNNAISSVELAEQIGITQKSAWLLQQKIRYALDQDDVLLSGIIAQDEMYIGGNFHNFPYGKKLRVLRNFGIIDATATKYSKSQLFKGVSMYKFPTFGMNDSRRIVLQHLPNPISAENVAACFGRHTTDVEMTVADESKLYTDWIAPLVRTNHQMNVYTNNGYSSNCIEGTFSHFKRNNIATYVHQKCDYLQLYYNEFCWKWNHRNQDIMESVDEAFDKLCKCHITYKELRAYVGYSQYGKKKTPQDKFNEIKGSLRFPISKVIIDGITFRVGRDW